MIFSFPAEQWPLWLATGILTLLLAWAFLARLERRRSRRLHGFADRDLLARLVLGYAPHIRWPLNLYVLLGLACLFLALAGPRWGHEVSGQNRGSRDILVLLDTSESMNANDPPPNRLARARQKITALLRTYPADRFGLIAFSGAAALQCPLTRDHAYFKTVLESVTTDSLTAEGTDIESAFLEVEKLFMRERGRGRGATQDDRIVLLISDGEEVSGDAVEKAGDLASLAHVVVMGIGDPEGAEVTLPQWMQRSGPAANAPRTHWSVLDEVTLAKIALAGNGVYVRSTLGNEDLDVIGRELELLEGYRSEHELRASAVNRYRWPLALAVVFFAAEGAWLVLMPALARREQAPRGSTNAGAVHDLA